MKTIDFLSDSPKSFIFRQDSNKTLFGGILSLIYLIIVLIIASFYLVSYIINEKYTVEYGYYQNILDTNKKQELEKSPKYNPTTKFGYVITDGNTNENLDNNTIILMDLYNKSLPNVFSLPVSDLSYIILYKCQDKICNFDKIKNNYIKFYLVFNGFKLDHQGEIPIYQQEEGAYFFTSSYYLKSPSLKVYTWKIIKYTENLGFSDFFYNLFGIEKDNEYIGGNINDIESFSLKDIEEEILEPFQINNTYYRVIGMGLAQIDFNSYDQYKRTKISIFDIIANICSLSMTVFSGFFFCFSKFYSVSYNNYEIAEKILSKNNFKNINKKIEEENREYIINRDSSISDKLLRDSKPDDTNIKITDKDEEKLIKEDYDSEKNRILPKIKFIDFILSKFTFDKCWNNSKPQIIISSCNNLISKYYSIDYIIYNQIILENLLKDYKWNDPALNNIESNEFITRITNNLE